MTNISYKNAKRPCLIFSNGLGDHFMILPTLRAISLIFKGELSVIVQKFSFVPDIFFEINLKEIIEIDFFDEGDNSGFNVESLAPQIINCDFLISLNTWESKETLEILSILNIKNSVGFHRGFSKIIPYDTNKHYIDANFDVALLLDKNLKIEDFSYKPNVGRGFQDLQLKLKSILPKNFRTLVVHTETLKPKMWSEKKIIHLLDKLLEKYPDIGVILVDQKQINFNGAKYKDRISGFKNDELSFRVACGFTSIADFFLGIDSVFLHVSDFYRIPSVGLFGPTSSVQFGLRYCKHKHVNSTTNSMSEITVETVFQAMESLID